MQKLITLNKLSDFIELRDRYLINWPQNSMGYYTLDNFIKWFKSEKESHLKYVYIYSVDNKWRESGLYVILDRFQLFVNTLDPVGDGESLAQALKLLDWTRGYKLTALPTALHDTVAQILRDLKIEWHETTLNTYRMSKERALTLQTNCPPDFLLRQLTQADAEIINNSWHSRQRGTLQFIQRLIAYNPSVGVVAKDTNILAAWCTRCQCGFLGMLHVQEEFRRRGLAELITNAFALQLAASGEDVLALVRRENKASNALFQKCNFEKETMEPVHHLFAYRVENDLIWPHEG